ncbi:MAG: DUF503 domain-containing protein [Thermoanaerobaculia bacterium]
MLVVVALFELHIEFAQSLKDKRMVVKSLREKLRNRFDMSVAEVALHDTHQRARMGLSFVALEHSVADANLDRIQNFIESSTDAVVSGWTSEKLEFDEMTGL